jgi:hypothetical protein
MNIFEKPRDYTFHQYRLVNDRVVEHKEICVHSFDISGHDLTIIGPWDTADSSLKILRAAQLNQWTKSEKGQWVLKNTTVPLYFSSTQNYTDTSSPGIRTIIVATFEPKKITEYHLRFSTRV